MKTVVAHALVLLSFILCTNDTRAQEKTSGIRKFAFGTPDSVLRSRFTKVTVKDAFIADKGHGFIGAGSPGAAPGEQGPERLRLMIETDAGGDPDDEQSLVRFLLYANEWDIEGIIANRARAREGENLNRERTGLGIVRRMIEAYAACYTNLVQHDPRYPPPETLRRRTVSGYSDSEEGVRLVLNALQSEDRRPLWFLNWGTDHGSSPSCLKRALDQILERRGQQAYAALKARIRLSSADAFGDHTWRIAPPWALWVDTFNPELSSRRWYHRFSALTARAGGLDIDKDVRLNHGPLGALYPTNTTHPQKEGDTMTFLYLIPTGLGDPEEPMWGSWAGRYGLRDSSGRQYYWANQSDVWNGSTNRDNSLLRWASALQHDFKARLDWCVKPFKNANHPPQLVLNGADGMAVLRVEATPGAFVDFDFSGSSDPDSDNLHFDCFVYREAGTCSGSPTIFSKGHTARLNVPKEAASKTIHVIVTATDSGSPPLTRYRRAVVKVRPTTKPSAELNKLAICRLHLFEPLMAAIADKPAEAAARPKPSAPAAPYAPSPVIARLEWAPTNTIIRQAPGSDNWPLTWAEDDALYGAYGDGNGFEPFTAQKLSLGFARITGAPPDAAGSNIRSTGEARGDGPRGKKASGMLCVDAVLYLLVRNVGNSQLGWSVDHGSTWTWADWKFTTSFGCPTFLNFGKNYAGARDGFVYLYSPDHANAYEPADRMVLARVPRDQLRYRSAYEFFVRLNTQGQPVWSKDIMERGAVFSHPGRCCRSGITYNAALMRYLWVQILPQSRHPQGPRFQGGLGVYDAPEPWGPWTTVYFTEDWDVGPGETGTFPAKWISADGQSLTYIFSGEDSFSIRQATLTLHPGNHNSK